MSLENITQQHILDAVSKIENEGILLEPSAKYDVIVSGKPYPPKEIMRYANFLANGDKTWPHPGGEPTNRYLEKFGFSIQPKISEPDIELDTQVPLTGNIWKLGCNWDSGQPNFYEMLKKYSIVIGVFKDNKIYAIGDLMLITEGFSVRALGKILENPKPVTDFDDLKAEFDNYKIDYESWVNVARVEWYELASDEIFTYELQKGISRVSAPNTRNTAINIWNNRFVDYCQLHLKPGQFEILADNKFHCSLESDNDYAEIGDKVIIWVHGENEGCYGLGSIFNSPGNRERSFGTRDIFVDLAYDLSKKPLLWKNIKEIKGLESLKNDEVGSHPGFEPQYKILLKLVELREKAMNNRIDLSLNTILYGPPGTGKTYRLNQYKEDYFIDRAVAQTNEDILKEKVSAYPFWKILGAVMGAADKPLSVGEIIEHPMIKAWINPAMKTKPNNIVWRELQSYANDESTQLVSKYRRAIKIFHKSNESKWSISEDKKADLGNIIGQDLVDIANNSLVPVTVGTTSIERYRFITFHQKYSYEDFIEGIKPSLPKEEDSEPLGELQFELKKGIFYESCLKALKLVGYSSFKECHDDTINNRIARFDNARHNKSQQFAVFIDEINRANIAAVFGELITLLEDDKRIGGSNELWVKLPYSGEDFCVPSNLYVIGTMNTADRSIALIDIALRRRFEFKALYPKYDTGEWWASFLEKLNQAIYNWKKNPDFFIGHAFFINRPASDRLDILNRKIIPLLVEYCQNNTEMVKRILNEADVQLKKTDIKENFQIIAE
jgi:hypothetical protein